MLVVVQCPVLSRLKAVMLYKNTNKIKMFFLWWGLVTFKDTYHHQAYAFKTLTIQLIKRKAAVGLITWTAYTVFKASCETDSELF